MIGNIVLATILIVSIYNYVTMGNNGDRKFSIKTEKRAIATVVLTTLVVLIWRLF